MEMEHYLYKVRYQRHLKPYKYWPLFRETYRRKFSGQNYIFARIGVKVESIEGMIYTQVERIIF
ncbi:DUF3823 domain-containing protein [Pareuzebyella sediminis]|uniref:DUF3823 domain-containing protein n=1 Tax=Pareuzebyella sediminis TaxID=2607998 RepID=UPI0018E1BC25